MIWTADPHIHGWLPRLQAHRGLWVGGIRENTLESVQAAYAAGYGMCEFDVRVTRDGEVVLFHDDHHQQRPVARTSYADFNRLIPVTKLEELLTWFAGTKNFKLNIEIKSRRILHYHLEKQVCDLIARFGLEDRVLISSFNPISLYKIRRYNPRIYRALLLTFEKNHGNNIVVKSGVMNYMCRPHVLHLRYQDYTRHFRRLGRKIPIVLWTVNDAGIYRRLRNEVHGIISDRITPEEFAREVPGGS